MESWGPGIHSLEAFNVKFGWFFQHTSLMKNIIVIVNPQCQLQAQESVMWCPEELCSIHRCDAFNMNFGHFVQYTSLSKKVFDIFYITLRASFRLKKALKKS